MARARLTGSRGLLRVANRWLIVERREAERYGWKIEPLEPTHDPANLRVVLDSSCWIELLIEHSWIAAFRIAAQAGAPIVSEIRFFPAADSSGQWQRAGEWKGMNGSDVPVPPGGITARLLRHIKTKEFRHVLKELLAKWPSALSNLNLPEPAPHPIKKSAVGRKGRSDVELARMAETYERACVNRRPPISAVAKRFHLSASQARDAIFRVRQVGFLSPADKRGSVGGLGGLMTARARQVLQKKRP